MFILYDKNMNEIKIPEGVTPLDVFISSIEKERVTGKIEGSHRTLNYGSTYNYRSVELTILMNSYDTKDYRLLRDSVYALFQKYDEFYVSESYMKGKRYLVSVDQSFIPDRIPNNRTYAEALITCTKIGLPFAESIGTTQDIHNNGINANDAIWGFGMGLIADDESLIYTHTGTSFKIYNAGNVPVHPFEQDLKITIDNIQGSTGYFELRNITTGDLFRVNEGATGTIVLDGPNITRNNLNYLRQTNKQYITLAPGWNHFTINGANSARVAFDFRYYYQ